MTWRIMAGIDAAQCQWIAEDTEWASTANAQGKRTPGQRLPSPLALRLGPFEGLHHDLSDHVGLARHSRLKSAELVDRIEEVLTALTLGVRAARSADKQFCEPLARVAARAVACGSSIYLSRRLSM
jgi:hypothetical protein